jgi:hypothetical protein
MPDMYSLSDIKAGKPYNLGGWEAGTSLEFIQKFSLGLIGQRKG